MAFNRSPVSVRQAKM